MKFFWNEMHPDRLYCLGETDCLEPMLYVLKPEVNPEDGMPMDNLIWNITSWPTALTSLERLRFEYLGEL